VPRAVQESPSVRTRDGPSTAQLPDKAARIGTVPLMGEKRWVCRNSPPGCDEKRSQRRESSSIDAKLSRDIVAISRGWGAIPLEGSCRCEVASSLLEG
jgi:hypothetical protein